MRVLFNFEPEPVPGLGVPTVFEFVKTDEQRKVLTFFASNVLLGRPIMAPPGVPADRVAAAAPRLRGGDEGSGAAEGGRDHVARDRAA